MFVLLFFFYFIFHSAARKPEKSVIAPTLMHSENPLSSPKADNCCCGVDSQLLVPGLKAGAGGEGSPFGEGALTQCPASPRAYPRGTRYAAHVLGRGRKIGSALPAVAVTTPWQSLRDTALPRSSHRPLLPSPRSALNGSQLILTPSADIISHL